MADEHDTESPLAGFEASAIRKLPEVQNLLKGSGKRISELEAQLEAARAEGGDAVARLADAEKLSATAAASLDALVAKLPEDRRQLVPSHGSVSDRLAYVTANWEALSALPHRDPVVALGPSRTGGPSDPQKAELRALDRAIARKNRGQR